MLERLGYEKHAMTVITDNNGFDKVVEYLQREADKSPIYKDPLETLENFVQELEDEPENSGWYKKIIDSGHATFLQAFVKFSLMKAESKRGAVWLWGSPNTGKTTLLNLLGEIFHCTEYTQTRSKFDLNYANERKQS